MKAAGFFMRALRIMALLLSALPGVLLEVGPAWAEHCYCSDPSYFNEEDCVVQSQTWICEPDPVPEKREDEDESPFPTGLMTRVMNQQGSPNGFSPGGAIVSNTRNRGFFNHFNGILSGRFGWGFFGSPWSGPGPDFAPGAGFEGLSSGDDSFSSSLWLNSGLSFIGSGKRGEEFDGVLYNLIAGFDRELDKNLIGGLAFGFEHAGLNTDFNHGGLTSYGYTLAPYVGLLLWESLILELKAGVSLLDNNGYRRDMDGRHEDVHTSFRYMADAGLSWRWLVGRLELSANGGFLYATEVAESYTTWLGEFRAGGRVGYLFERFTPYAGAQYLYDAWLGPNGDDADPDEFRLSLGLSILPSDALTLDIQGEASLGREQEYDLGGAVNINYSF